MVIGEAEDHVQSKDPTSVASENAVSGSSPHIVDASPSTPTAS
jgi:hypothetical protein